jgi:subtilisin family serine protease
MMKRIGLGLLAFSVSSLILAAPAVGQQRYVLVASKWTSVQTGAVNAAGGTVIFSHAASGVAVATSSNPDFLSRVLRRGAIQSGEADAEVSLPPQRVVSIDELGITPTDETFWMYQWAPRSVLAPEAWEAGCTGRGVRVAIVDGGIYDIHADLAPNFDAAASRSFVPNEVYNTDTGTFWHGTHVAGIVAAADNHFGVIGIAPEATLIGVKVLHGGTGSFSWVLQGILYAATPLAEGGAGADIINMSLGVYYLKAGGHNTLFAALNNVVNYAASLDVLVVSAAGNDGLDLDRLPSYEFVPGESGNGLAISATGPVGFAYGATNFRRPASYTNYGNSAITVAAPGGDDTLYGDFNDPSPDDPNWYFDMVFSTIRGSSTPPSYSFGFADGTSMAAPAASAVAALAKQSHPGISLGALKTLLARTADDEGKSGHDPYYGRGFVNAYRACTAR